MEFVADVLLVGGALGASVYCYVLARRLAKFNDLEKGVGGAVAVLSAQVDDLTKTLEAAQNSANDSSTSLGDLTMRADGVAQRLELLVASMHDLPASNAAASVPAERKRPEQSPDERGERNDPIFLRHARQE